MYVLSTLVVCLFVLKLMGIFFDYIPRYICTRTIESVASLLLLIFLEYTEFTIYSTGLVATKQEIKRTIKRCGLICLGIILAFLLVRIIMNQHSEAAAGRPWFKPYFFKYMRWYYPFTAIMQEVFAKGIMQENMKRLFGEDDAKWSLLACSILFALYHVNYPLYYIICAGVLNFVTGRIYEKDHNIWGCTMIHFCVGFLPRAMGLK